ncbi:MAG: HAD family hydrolase [Chlorobium sp.]|jgi:D-glycero-D-manno-heptose 1,7-bisphosphate phosphatase|uniref:D-glycero-alpha-D-manno-heptose-1,7-bisphosphate 7-phosphatase n=1 Tax=Chlorobium sp. TaxID=1095 RepID=UPI001D623705|nr:HAD family hydrolase [Chlorobium sp.]MBN1278469.1 HAD family hydrolase [Chlorobiaceae bacterium]MCF8215462.1 HAD family hydrolase [Chlorobium sp.]MCF8270313.1 HAD family hydrolase [Chlorobium sp.]MCF8286669.1 HAD family hydrolase [Chlorobium sp.]MCF8290362.1 HAD family hydrolase [Chlorobium sp.]
MAETVKVLFLDRDGTINEDTGSYITSRAQFQLIEGAGEAIALARAAGYRVVVVTNQAGIARGITTIEQVEDLNRYLNELLEAWHTRYDRCYYCPSHPDHPHPLYDLDAGCRKPEPGMVERAIADFLAEGQVVDRSSSFFVGDKIVDVECGLRAGLRPVLVRTGHNEEQLCINRGIIPEHVADDLYRAVTGHILA